MTQIAESSAAADFERLAGRTPKVIHDGKQRRKCDAIARSGERCRAWAVTGLTQCAVHSGLVTPNPAAATKASQEAAERRREARQSVRARAASALDDDFDDVLSALRAGIRDGKPAERARAAIGYVQLVYGRQLQQPTDERVNQADELDIASMPKAQRDELKRRLLEQHPHLVAELGLDIGASVAETTDTATPTA